MTAIFVNRFYWPETPATGQLLTDLAEGLQARGGEITVITSAAGAEAPRRQVHRGVKILRVAGTRWSRHGTLGKAVDFGTFYLGALWLVLREARRGTIVIPMTDPPLLSVGIWLAARCRGAAVVHWIQDIYPEIALQLFAQPWLRVLRPVRNLAWRSADRCVTLGTDMTKALFQAGVRPERVTVVPNWSPAGISAVERSTAAPLRREWGLVGKFVVAYSGNLGRVHDLAPVIALAEALRHEPEFAVILVGDGAQRPALEAAARDRALTNLSFHPPQPREQLPAALAVGDLHLVTLRPGCEDFVFPSKLYGIAAAGRPILFIGPPGCELARCIRENGLGHVAARDEVAAMAAAVRDLASDSFAYSAHVRQCIRFAERHTAAVATGKWHTLLASIAGSPRAASGR